MTQPSQWHVGQKAVINRQLIVEVTRVTPSGRVVVVDRAFGKKTFNPDGTERSGTSFQCSRLEALTDEIEAEMALVVRCQDARERARKMLEKTDRWLRNSLPSWSHSVPELADVERAERIADALDAVMKDAP